MFLAQSESQLFKYCVVSFCHFCPWLVVWSAGFPKRVAASLAAFPLSSPVTGSNFATQARPLRLQSQHPFDRIDYLSADPHRVPSILCRTDSCAPPPPRHEQRLLLPNYADFFVAHYAHSGTSDDSDHTPKIPPSLSHNRLRQLQPPGKASSASAMAEQPSTAPDVVRQRKSIASVVIEAAVGRREEVNMINLAQVLQSEAGKLYQAPDFFQCLFSSLSFNELNNLLVSPNRARAPILPQAHVISSSRTDTPIDQSASDVPKQLDSPPLTNTSDEPGEDKPSYDDSVRHKIYRLCPDG